MMLLTCNAQSELTALEKGLHALRRPKNPETGEYETDVKAYAESAGRKRTTVHAEVYAAEVATAVPDIGNGLSPHFAKLVEIHAARPWLWPALVQAMLPPAGGAAVAISSLCLLGRRIGPDAAASRRSGGCDGAHPPPSSGNALRDGFRAVVVDHQL